jgi:hypothetical protein
MKKGMEVASGDFSWLIWTLVLGLHDPCTDFVVPVSRITDVEL